MSILITNEERLWKAFLDVVDRKLPGPDKQGAKSLDETAPIKRAYQKSWIGVREKLKKIDNHNDKLVKLIEMGLIDEDLSLGFRFKINILAREVLVHDVFDRVKRKFPRGFAMLENRAIRSRAHELATVAILTGVDSPDSAERFCVYGVEVSPFPRESSRRYRAMEKLERTICDRLCELLPDQFGRASRAYDVIFGTTYKGRNAIRNFIAALQDLKSTKINLSMLRLEDPKVLSKDHRENSNYNAFNRFILNQGRKNTVGEILDFLTKSPNEKEPVHNLGMIRTLGMQRGATAMIAYLLTNKHKMAVPGIQSRTNRYLHQHFQDIVVIPCSLYSKKGPRITYGKLVAMLHAYLYPDQHPDLEDQKLEEGETFYPFEDQLDLSSATLHDNARELRSKLKDIRWAMLNRSVLIIFNGLVSQDDVEPGTYFTRVGIADNPAIMLVRNLTKPGYSDAFYKKNSGGLKTFFLSRILVFANGETSPLTPFISPEYDWTLAEPKINLTYLLDGESEELTQCSRLVKRFESLTSNAINHSVFYAASCHDNLLDFQGSGADREEFENAFTHHFKSFRQSETIRKKVVENLMQSMFASQPLFFVALAFMTITTGGTRPITLARFIDRFVRVCKSINDSQSIAEDAEEHIQSRKLTLAEQINLQQISNSNLNIESLAQYICREKSLVVTKYVPECYLAEWGMARDNWDFPSLFLKAIGPFVFKKNNETHLAFDQYTDQSGYANDILDEVSPFQTNFLGQRDRLKKCAEENKLLFICELRARKDTRELLESFIGKQGLALLHLIIMEESLRAHELLLRHSYWLDESYRQYRYMFQTLLHGFSYLRIAGTKNLISQHFDMPIPWQHDRLFIYLYSFLFGDLTEDRQRYNMSRNFEATTTRIELLDLADGALRAIKFRDRTEGASRKDILAGCFDKKTKAEISHELTISRAVSKRREGQLTGRGSAQEIACQHIQALEKSSMYSGIKEYYTEKYKTWLTECELLLVDTYILAGGEEGTSESVIYTKLSKMLQRALTPSLGTDSTQLNYLSATFSHKIDAVIAFIFRDWEAMLKHLKADKFRLESTILTNVNSRRQNAQHKKLISLLEKEKHAALKEFSIEEMLAEVASDLRNYKNIKLEKFSPEILGTLSDIALRKAEYLFYIPIKGDFSAAEWEQMLRAYLYFKLADLFRRMIFSRAHDSRKHFINAHALRANIRLLYKMHLNKPTKEYEEEFAHWPGLHDFSLMDEARYLIDSLSLMTGTFQRERTALLVLESQYSRIRYKNYDHAFKLHTQAERYLSYGAPNLLVAARLFTVRLKLCSKMLHLTDLDLESERPRYWHQEELRLMMRFDCNRLQQLASRIGTPYWTSKAKYWKSKLGY